MSRQAVAALCGRSEEWLRQIERGNRGTSLRMVGHLADVLKLADLAVLLGPAVPTAVYARPAHPALLQIRRVLIAPPTAPPDEIVDIADLQRRVVQAWRLRSLSHRDRTDLSATLPAMIIDAQRAAGAQSPLAYRLLAEVYHLSQLYLCYQDAPELLWVVADRARAAAQASEDAAAKARAAWFSAYLYRDFGAIDLAHQVVDDAIRGLDASRDDSPAARRQRCVVQLASAWNHAREGRPGPAWRAWDAATASNSRTPSPQALFGTTCEDVALTLDIELGRPSSAIRRAEGVDTESIASVPRQARLMVEAARGYALNREHAGAVHLLLRAHQVSPEATRYSMHARGLVHDLRAAAGPMLRPDLDRLAEALGAT